MDIDREDTYEVLSVLKDGVYSDDSALLLVKSDYYYPPYEPDFRNRHDREIDMFFESNGIDRINAVPLLYTCEKDGKNLFGSVVSGGENPSNISPFITLQVREPGMSSPVYILRPENHLSSYENRYSLSVDGDPRVSKLESSLNCAQMYRHIINIYLMDRSGKKYFPKENEDPFLLLSKDLSKIDRRFAGF